MELDPPSGDLFVFANATTIRRNSIPAVPSGCRSINKTLLARIFCWTPDGNLR
jgi:hypothetical protein